MLPSYSDPVILWASLSECQAHRHTSPLFVSLPFLKIIFPLIIWKELLENKVPPYSIVNKIRTFGNHLQIISYPWLYLIVLLTSWLKNKGLDD